MKTIIKFTVKTALAAIGLFSFFILLGEPTQEYADRIASCFGGLAPYVVLAEKMASIAIMALCCKCYEKIEPGVFDDK